MTVTWDSSLRLEILEQPSMIGWGKYYMVHCDDYH